MDNSPQTLISLFTLGSVHSGSASWDNCGRVFPDKLRVNSSPDKFPHYAWTAAQSAHSDFVGSRVYACLGVTCHLQFWQYDRGLFSCHCGNTGIERTPNKSQHTKLTLRKKILPLLLPGFELAAFRSRVRRSANKLSRLSRGTPARACTCGRPWTWKKKHRTERGCPKEEPASNRKKEIDLSSSGSVLQKARKEGKSTTGKYYRESMLAEVNRFYKRAWPNTGVRRINLFHDNAPADKGRLVQEYRAKENIEISPPRPYSPREPVWPSGKALGW